MKQLLLSLVVFFSMIVPVLPAAPEAAPVMATLKGESFDNDEFDKAFNHAIYSIKYNRNAPSSAALWALMERFQKALKNTKDAQKRSRAEFDYKYLTVAILKQGSDADYEKLIETYKALPGDSWGRRVMIEPLANYWIKREITALEKAGIRPTLATATNDELLDPALSPEAKETVKAAVQAAGPRVQKGWRQYRFFAAALEEVASENTNVSQGKSRVSVQETWPLFYGTADDFFAGKTQNMAPRLAAFQWGHWCGTGSEQFYDPKYRLLFATLLKERRYAPAIGALFRLMTWGGNGLWSDPEDDWKQRFLSWCGVDWEALFAGAALEHQATLRELALYGSPQAAQLLVEMAAVPKITEHASYLQALAAFIEGSRLPTGYGSSSSSDIKRRNQEPVPVEVQKQLLQVLGEQIQPGTKPYTLQTVTHLLVDKARPESKEALRRLLQMPYGELREKAALALRAMGEEAQAEPVKPLLFRLLRNGHVSPHTNVRWEIRAGDSAVSSERNADEKGVLALKRELLVDAPQAPRFLFAARDITEPNDLWFETQRDKPADLEAVTDIAIETGALALQIETPQPAAFYKGKKLLLDVSAERPLSTTSYFRSISGYEKMEVPFQSSIRFPQLQKRAYEIEIRLPGAARWKEKIILDEDQKTVSVKLKKGADLRFEIITPGGELRDKAPSYVLLRDSKPFDDYLYNDYASRGYKGLPAGNYTLKILSSAARQKRYPPREGELILTPSYQGAERTFTIDDKSPEVLDLGRIALQKAP
jgi:hypothetical protein